MQYESYSNRTCLKTTFDSVLQTHQNIVLQAGSLQEPVNDFARSVCEGLDKKPRQLECRFLYDAKGSELYEQICSQPEYYPTRTEAAILRDNAEAIGELTGPCHLIELGSGSSVKTDFLLSAYQRRYGPLCYTPIDISASALKLAGRSIIDKRPDVQVIAIHGTYSDSFQVLSCSSPSLIIFLGSTLGNFHEDEEYQFWQDITCHMQPGDYFLLGVDLIKDPSILEAAYNDAAGITAAFTKNYFARMNRELGANLDLDHIEHVAAFNPEKSRVEIDARFSKAQDIHVKPLDRKYSVAGNERIHVEISRKFRLPEVEDHLRYYGLESVETFTDPHNWFALLLLQKSG